MPLKDNSRTSTRTIRENASIVRTPFDLFRCVLASLLEGVTVRPPIRPLDHPPVRLTGRELKF